MAQRGHKVTVLQQAHAWRGFCCMHTSFKLPSEIFFAKLLHLAFYAIEFHYTEIGKDKSVKNFSMKAVTCLYAVGAGVDAKMDGRRGSAGCLQRYRGFDPRQCEYSFFASRYTTAPG